MGMHMYCMCPMWTDPWYMFIHVGLNQHCGLFHTGTVGQNASTYSVQYDFVPNFTIYLSTDMTAMEIFKGQTKLAWKWAIFWRSLRPVWREMGAHTVHVHVMGDSVVKQLIIVLRNVTDSEFTIISLWCSFLHPMEKKRKPTLVPKCHQAAYKNRRQKLV